MMSPFNIASFRSVVKYLWIFCVYVGPLCLYAEKNSAPTPDELSELIPLIQELVAEDIAQYKAHKITAKELGNRIYALEKDAEQTETQFAIYMLANKYYVEAEDYESVLALLEKMETHYEGYNATPQRLVILPEAVRRVRKGNARAVVSVVNGELERLINTGKYKDASQIIQSIKRNGTLTAMVKNPAWLHFLEITRSFDKLLAAEEEHVAMLQRVKRNPKNPKIQLDYARFLLITFNDWEAAGQIFMKYGDTELVEMVRAEFNGDMTIENSTKFADFYWNRGGRTSDPQLAAAYWRHAEDIYMIALTAEVGLRKSLISKRLTEIRKKTDKYPVVQRIIRPIPGRLTWNLFLSPSIDLHLKLIPKGFFQRRFAPAQVSLNYEFYMAEFEVTQAQYMAVMRKNPSSNFNANLPVENVSWTDAINFCSRLNVEYVDSIPRGYEFRLPTENEWEYACAAGTNTQLNSGKNIEFLLQLCDNVDEVAWCGFNSQNKIHPPGLKKPNKFSLYDMHGNVAELCLDGYISDEKIYASVTKPLNPYVKRQNKYIVRRGDAAQDYWGNGSGTAARSKFGFSQKSPDTGFRIVLAPMLTNLK